MVLRVPWQKPPSKRRREIIVPNGSSTATNFIVTNGGNVGIGTTNPNLVFGAAATLIPKLQIAAANITAAVSATRFSDDASPSRFVLAKSRGVSVDSFSPLQSGDQVGGILFSGSNNSLDASSTAANIIVSLDANPTAGQNFLPGTLIFYTNGNFEQMRISSGGKVGIGTANPNQGKVEVKGGTVCVDTNSDDSATSCIANESDERLKDNITSISASSSLDTVLALRPVSFDWRASDPEVLKHYPLISRFAGNTRSIGLIAQEVMPLLPEALSLETVGDAEVQYYQLDYTKFIPHIIGAVQALFARVHDLATPGRMATVAPFD